MPVAERAPFDVLAWDDDVGDRRSGDGDAVSTTDGEASRTGTLDRPSVGVGVGDYPSFVATGDLRLPCLGFGGSNPTRMPSGTVPAPTVGPATSSVLFFVNIS